MRRRTLLAAQRWPPPSPPPSGARGRIHRRLRLYRPAPRLGLEPVACRRRRRTRATAGRAAGRGTLPAREHGLWKRAGRCRNACLRARTEWADWRRRRHRVLHCLRQRPVPAHGGAAVCRIPFRQASLLPLKERPGRLGSQNALIHEGHYVNGVAAGLSTRTNRLGFVAGLPLGAVLLNVNAFLLGARRTNPQARVHVTFTGGWENATRDAAATNALIDAGCDVVTCHLDAPAPVIATAESRGVRSCGHAFDQAPLAPRGYITGADYHWTAMFRGFVERDLPRRQCPARLRHRWLRQELRALESVRRRCQPGGDRGGHARHRRDEGRPADLHRTARRQPGSASPRGRHHARRHGRSPPAHRLSARRSRRLAPLIASLMQTHSVCDGILFHRCIRVAEWPVLRRKMHRAMSEL